MPDHEPGLTVRVLPSCGLPESVGAAVFFGAEPVAFTTSVGRETAMPEPLLFVAVTCTRRRLSTSPDDTVYVWLVAPVMGVQLPAWALQRSHWYA